ncbi:MAG: ergothioneine biosynthesis protein EgtB [Balneolaceae bacterium]|nr:ergothioneine biosynthesis protein EgtB [Balneolaceae bacterium]MCH8547692.1 ergothioneine biosynthesis protein EgtB [Balneolaceae bacterium]
MSAEVQSAPTENGIERFSREKLLSQFREVRSFTEQLTDPLETEDFVIQIATHGSPAKWHLAHSSWFFEAFLLEKAVSGFESMHPKYSYLFNSYYLQTGDPHCRDKRGNLSRPTVKEVFEYRKYVNEQVEAFIKNASEDEWGEWAGVIEIGINHEQQHQELLITDLKMMLAQNPLHSAYKEKRTRPKSSNIEPLTWISFDEGVHEIGHNGSGFGYDNEFPRHKTYIHSYSLANRLVTNGEYLEFMKSGAYGDPKLWLDEGFSLITEEKWYAPKYWKIIDGEWHHFTLNGLERVDPNEPVTHVSYFEADAYARWKGCRLPTEQEWELASETEKMEGNFVDAGHLHPVAESYKAEGFSQMFGEVWQWTSSAYSAYPGYKPFPGKLGEYNGKFMCNQYVLRGGSCATSENHYRKTYRNFFHTRYRWQFTGIRLAKDLSK